MSDLLNKYTKNHDEFIAMLIKYYPLHEAFLERQSPRRTGDLRKVLKQMRLAIKSMEEVAQLRMHERRVEWGAVNRLKKEDEDE
jgi:hypothetical protein